MDGIRSVVTTDPPTQPQQTVDTAQHSVRHGMPCACLHKTPRLQQEQQEEHRDLSKVFSVQQVPAVHGMQLLEVCVEAEGFDIDLQCRHRVLHTKGSQHLWVDDAKDTHLQRETHITQSTCEVSCYFHCLTLSAYTYTQAGKRCNQHVFTPVGVEAQAQLQPQTTQ